MRRTIKQNWIKCAVKHVLSISELGGILCLPRTISVWEGEKGGYVTNCVRDNKKDVMLSTRYLEQFGG